MASLLYGSGLRRIELVRLRIKDIDLDHLQIQVWNGKGFKHRLVTLAPELREALLHQKAQVKLLFEQDKQQGEYAGVWMPDALARKYPAASLSLSWQYLFPSSRLSYEPGTSFLRRHHFDESNINKILCYAPTSVRGRYSNSSGTTGSRRCENNGDIYSRAQTRRLWRSKSSEQHL